VTTTPEPVQNDVPPATMPEPEIVVQTAPANEGMAEEPAPVDDYDTPAFLRRQRRMVQ